MNRKIVRVMVPPPGRVGHILIECPRVLTAHAIEEQFRALWLLATVDDDTPRQDHILITVQAGADAPMRDEHTPLPFLGAAHPWLFFWAGEA